MPKVSVITPSFNYARYLPLAVESVLSQSHSDLELIIIDDCSRDGSRDVAEQWKRLDDRVVTVAHEQNRGLAAARNSGLAISSGEFVAFCDADDIWLRDKLTIQLEWFQRNPETGLGHADSLIMDADGNLTGQRFSELIHRKGQITSGNLFEDLCQRNFLCVPTVILRREAIERAGGFESTLRSLEDWVCWTKVSMNYPFYFIEEPLAQYRVHQGNLSSDLKGMAYNSAKALRLLLDEFPNIPPSVRSRMLYSLGMSHLKIGDSRSALKAFVDSIETDASHIRSWARCCQAAVEFALESVRGSAGADTKELG